jgi:hypothetical protein
LSGEQLLLRLRSVKTIKEMVCPDCCKPLSEAGLIPPREFRDVGRLDLRPKAFEEREVWPSSFAILRAMILNCVLNLVQAFVLGEPVELRYDLV